MTYFDERAKTWDSEPARVERAWVVANAIRAALPLHEGMTALEYGCGTGLLSFALLRDFASITLTDTSQGMLEVLAEKIESSGVDNMHPLRLDLTSQPLPDTRFDVIYSLMTMHHIPETEEVLRQTFTLLHPGGYLCIADLEKEDGSFHGQEETNVHKGFDRSELQAKLEKTGFENIHFSSVYNVKKIVDGREKFFPVFLMVAQRFK
jgi:ubiquinone/menaquinone biosynthesis C-methylase UbiE